MTGACGIAAAVALAVYMLPAGSPAHAISVPQRLAGYVQQPTLLVSSGATALRGKIVASSGGEATHVVDAVYEDSASGSAKSFQIVVFVGGNLAGSAGSFIDSLTQALPGAFTISPGSLQGKAACIPSRFGRPAECAWADNDTFGVLVAPGLNAAALGTALRQMRPFIEHVVK